jgi:hypothetical protein
MQITWRRATLQDIVPCLTLQPSNRGDALPDVTSAIAPWEAIFNASFFLSVVIEVSPAVQGHRIIGFGSGVLVSAQFVDAEIATPRAYIASRVLASLEEGRSVLATSEMAARANAGDGVDVVILYNTYHADILDDEANQDVRMIFVNSLVYQLSGFRVSRILAETTTKPMEALHRESPEYQTIGEFEAIGHVIHLMTRKSVAALPGSMANPLFKSARPVLQLRNSDQELLLAALEGSTDHDLARQLGLTVSAIKARWRSTFARLAEVMPELVEDDVPKKIRGSQKRHRVLAYVRRHMEELRPYDWSERSGKAAVPAGRSFADI